MPELIFPKVKKGDMIVLVLHGRTRVPAKVIGLGDRYEKTGKLDLIAEDLPSHVAHMGTTQELRVRGKIEIGKNGPQVVGGTLYEQSDSPRIILTDAPYDALGRAADSWHTGDEGEEAPAAEKSSLAATVAK